MPGVIPRVSGQAEPHSLRVVLGYAIVAGAAHWQDAVCVGQVVVGSAGAFSTQDLVAVVSLPVAARVYPCGFVDGAGEAWRVRTEAGVEDGTALTVDDLTLAGHGLGGAASQRRP